MRKKTEQEEKKNGFVFYESWYDGAKYLKGKHRLSYLEAIINYGLYGEEIETNGVENALFSAIKPTIKFNRKQKANGQQGGGTEGNSNAKKTTQNPPKNDPNSSIYINDNDSDKYIDGEIDFDKEPPKGGEGETRPPASGFSPFEIFGKFKNVQLFADQYRTLCMTYGQEDTDNTIEDLSSKLADGSKQSSNHYATLDYWLRLHNDGGYNVTMSSKGLPPEDDPFFIEKVAWKAMNQQEQQDYLNEHNGLLPWEDPNYKRP